MYFSHWNQAKLHIFLILHAILYQNKTNPSEIKRNFGCFSDFTLNLTANKICLICTKHFFFLKYWENACIWLANLVTWPKFSQICDFSEDYSTFRSCKPYALTHSFANTSVHKIYMRQYKIIHLSKHACFRPNQLEFWVHKCS